MSGTPEAPRASVDHLFRHQAGQMTATLTRVFGLDHLDAIEDAVQDAMVAALRRWPFDGVPRNPRAWLIQVAKHRLLDRLRRVRRWERKSAAFERVAAAVPAFEPEGAFAGELRDDALRLVLACCHPAVPPHGQVALVLKVVGGFGTAEIARAFLAREEAVAQRLLRAKQRLRELHVALELPAGDALPPRLDTALEALYLMFNEGHAAFAGEDLVRRDLCHEAIRLVELLADHPTTGAPRVHALAALLLFRLHGSPLAAMGPASS